MTVANRKPLFVGQISAGPISIPATANTNRDGTGTITLVFTGAATTGSLLEVLKIKAVGTTSAGVINVFYKIGAGSYLLIGDMLVTAITPSTTVAAYEGYYNGVDMPLRVAAGDTIGISTTIAQAFTCVPEGGTLENKDTAPVAQ